MAKSSTSFAPGHNIRPRGRSFKNKLLDTIRENALLDVPEGSNKEEAEKAYLKHLAERAFDREDQNSNTLLKELLNKTYAGIKPTLPLQEFDFSENSTPAEQVTEILKAASTGVIAPDVAAIFVQAIKSSVDIEQATDIKERLEALEVLLSA
jgi:hypothetical protein